MPHGERGLLHDASVDRDSASRVGRRRATAIDLDGFFGLHPSLAPFKRLWDDGILAPIHAVGSPSNTRSHFDAQDYMESGTPDNKGTRDGWLNRYLAVKGTCDECKLDDRHASPARRQSAFQAVSMTPQTPRILEGSAPTVAMNSLDEFTIRTNGSQAERIEALYRTGNADVVHAAGGEMFEAMKILKAANPQQYVAAATAPTIRDRRSASTSADRAADQGGRRTRDRVRRRRRLGHARQSGRRDGSAREASRRFLEVDRARSCRTSAIAWPTSRS